jgi:hypothetical protein
MAPSSGIPICTTDQLDRFGIKLIHNLILVETIVGPYLRSLNPEMEIVAPETYSGRPEVINDHLDKWVKQRGYRWLPDELMYVNPEGLATSMERAEGQKSLWADEEIETPHMATSVGAS